MPAPSSADDLFEGHVLVKGQLEHGAHAGAHHLGREEIDRTRRGDHGGGGEGHCGAHERAQVAGVGQAVGVDDKAQRAVGSRRAPRLAERRRLGQGEDRHCGGRGFEAREPRGHPRVDRVDRSVGQGVAGFGEPDGDVVGLADHEDGFGPQPGRDAGRDEIVAFDQEGALALAVLADVQRRRSLDERVLSARKGG